MRLPHLPGSLTRAPRLPSTPGARAAAGAVVLVLLGVLVVVLTLLGPDEEQGPSAEPEPVPPTGSVPVEDPTGALDDLDGVEADARDVLAAWARPDLSYAAWWAGLQERLAPGARADYQDTEPSALPDLTLESVARVRNGPSDDTKTVFFTTSAGRFGVDMSRRPSSNAWLATRVLFPGQESSLR